jgi:uncharacterized surface protein with fasciclin (FAS1) repeats
MTSLKLSLLSLGFASLALACSPHQPADSPASAAGDMSAESSQDAEQDIVDTAVAAGSFKTLVAAVKAADMVDVLKGDGPYTVFAPTDAAFAKLPKGTVVELLKPENKAKLQDVLKYHVVSGKVMASDVVGIDEAETVQGGKLAINMAGGGVMINDANVVKADIEASNGVIHVIDTVVLPR